MKRYILTGAPGAGKTSILHRLAEEGLDVVEEAATSIIARERVQGDAEPWTREAFLEKVVALQRQRQVRTATADSVTVQVYDRSPICTYALSVFLGRPVPDSLAAELERITRERVYERQVFFVRNIGFCQPTEARRITFEQALAFERIHEQSYREFSYQLVEIPPADVAARAALIVNAISRAAT